MSAHLFVAAAYLDKLDPSVKWVLAAIADSADEQTLEAAPGLPKLRAWSGRSKSQVTRIVAELADPKGLGLIERISPGRLGRRAVYRVFPRGVPEIPHPDEVAARYIDRPADLVDNPESYPQNTPESGAHGCAPRGAWTPDQGRMGAPPSGNTSVFIRATTPNRPARLVDRPTPSASTGSGFPGARRAEPATFTRDLGAPCPIHPDQHHPCQLCARDAVDSVAARTAITEARKALTRTRITTTTAEEAPTP